MLLAAPAAASAQTYPEPSEPGPVAAKPKGPFKTHTVCKQKGRCDFTTIQKAVDKAKAGDTIRVRNGTYQEAVRITGTKKRYLKLIGNPKAPDKVLLKAKGNMQNGVAVNEADEVTVDGFMARGYKANGFFFTNLNGYSMNHLIARQTGVYGLYAFNTIGGEILNSEAYYVNDGAFYIGQTPPQTSPIRTMVRNVKGWGSPLGFSATNMRYVTITKSKFFNNAVGLAPNALDGEKYPPAEDNVIIDNDIFWNNFNFHAGQPAVRQARHRRRGAGRRSAPGSSCSAGAATGSRTTASTATTWPASSRSRASSWRRRPAARVLEQQRHQGNQFGLNGTDLNGRDVVYDGSGTNNCFTRRDVHVPGRRLDVRGLRRRRTPSARASRTRCSRWAGQGALAAGSSVRTRRWPGTPPLEVFQ